MLTLLITVLALFPPHVPLVSMGIASYYTSKECPHLTASGEKLNDRAFTCATKFGKNGDMFLVCSKERAIIVRNNDHGPHVKGRVIDLTKAAMEQLDPEKRGLIAVRIYKLN